MSNTSIVQGLFGVDPTQYQQQQQQLQNTQALQFAELSPMQQAQYGAFRGGQMLGGLGANLFGAQDPMLLKATMAKQLAGQFDLTTPIGMKQYAQALSENGAPDLAQMAIARAQEMAVQNATIGQKSGENINALIASGKFTPESLAKFQQTRNAGDLELADKGLSSSNKEKVAATIEANTLIESGNAEIGNYRDMIKKGEVQYGPVKNLTARATSAMGSPSQNALKQQEIESFITGQINEVLNAAKGVQAKDDALRAERQIKGFLAQNSNAGMDKALELLAKTKQRVKAGNDAYIESLTGSKPQTGGVPTSKTAIYSAVRAKKGWEDASDAEIQAAINSGKIKTK